MNKSKLNCSFCTKTVKEVIKIIAGPMVYICDECVELCSEIVTEEKQKLNTSDKPKGSFKHTPSKIKTHLDSYIIGQDSAKISLSLAAYTHYKRMANPDLKMKKSNVLMIGPTGSGKTLLVSTLAKLFDVPYAVCDATALTKAGYVGKDVESMLAELYNAADQNIEKAQRGIIYIDEIDKLRDSASGQAQQDPGGKSVQQALLKLLENSDVEFSSDGDARKGKGQMIKMNTSNILFICSGAFVGLTETNTQGLIKYGMIPELMGRLPVISKLNELTRSDLVMILSTPKDSIVESYKNWFETEKLKFEVTKEALEGIADLALTRNTGARGLQGILEDILQGAMFKAPEVKSKVIKLDKDLIPQFIDKRKAA